MIDIRYTQVEIPEHIKRQTKAQGAVIKAIREGVLTRPDTCELCGSVPPNFPCYSSRGKRHQRSAIVAHHWRGYEGDAKIDIWWICTSCNRSLLGSKYHDGSLTQEQARAIVLAKKTTRLVY